MIEGLIMLAAIMRGCTTADRVVAQGVADLRASLAVAPEWKLQGNGPSGRGHYVAERQVLAGMLDHLERSIAAALPDQAAGA